LANLPAAETPQGFVFWGGHSRVGRVEGWETVFALARDHETLPACRAAFRRLKGRGSALARRSLGCFILQPRSLRGNDLRHAPSL